MSKRKWKVYTTDELRDRFQPKPGSPAPNEDPQKVPMPNLKRRNSAPPGMIHFPPGTFSAGNNHNQQHNNSHSQQQTQPTQSQPIQPSPPISTRQQHELVKHARSSPTPKPSSSPYTSRMEKRRASLPFMPPPSSSYNMSHNNSGGSVPAIEAYLTHLQNIPLPHQDLDMSDEEPSPKSPQSPSQPLPSFQSLLQTIREDADEEDSEIKEIEERALQGSKSLPVFDTKSQPQLYIQPQYNNDSIVNHNNYNNDNNNHNNSHNNHNNSHNNNNNNHLEVGSPSSKFYRNAGSKSNENLPSLSRMSISDILG